MLDLRVTDRWLCHYTSAQTAFEKILPSRQLRLSPYRHVRDPLENQDFPNITFGGFESEAGELERGFGRALRGLNEIRQDMRILCLTQGEPEWGPPFGCGWARARMWEHYSDDHRGVCLVFDRERLCAALRAELKGLRTPFYEGSVKYTTDGFSGSHARHVGLNHFPEDKPFAEAAGAYIEEHHQDFFLLKTADWATEFEYRFAVIGPSSDDEYLFVDYRDALAAIIVGHEFPKWQEASARQAGNEAGAEYRRLNWEMGEPFPASGVSRPQ